MCGKVISWQATHCWSWISNKWPGIPQCTECTYIVSNIRTFWRMQCCHCKTALCHGVIMLRQKDSIIQESHVIQEQLLVLTDKWLNDWPRVLTCQELWSEAQKTT